MRNWEIGRVSGFNLKLQLAFCKQDDSSRYILNPDLSLPQRNANDYPRRLHKLVKTYCDNINSGCKKLSGIDARKYDKIRQSAELQLDEILRVLNVYHIGQPAKAFKIFSNMIDKVEKNAGGFPTLYDNPTLAETNTNLFRMRVIDDSRQYSPRELFHVPSHLRSLISSCRYSIAGYPSLYLTDSLSLAKREIDSGSHAIAARFSLVYKTDYNRILDFGIRPDDFNFSDDSEDLTKLSDDYIDKYLHWYPLIAACSFVRANSHQKKFHDEYVIPQLLMQWLREQGVPPAHSGVRSPNGPTPPPANNEQIELNDAESLHEGILKEAAGIVNSIKQFNRTNYLAYELENCLNTLHRHSNTVFSYALQLAVTHYAESMYMIPSKDKQLSISAAAIQSALFALEEFRKIISAKITERGDRRIGHMRKLLQDANKNLMWASEGGADLIGIRYFSCHDLLAATLGRNYVFPAELRTQPDGTTEEYSLYLMDRFQWTKPCYIEDYSEMQQCEKDLLSLRLLDGRKAIVTEC